VRRNSKAMRLHLPFGLKHRGVASLACDDDKVHLSIQTLFWEEATFALVFSPDSA
jgi:hypothetical protein